MKLTAKQKQIKTLANAQKITLIGGCILGMWAFYQGAQLTLDNPKKEAFIFIMGFAQLIIIFSIISILTNNKK